MKIRITLITLLLLFVASGSATAAASGRVIAPVPQATPEKPLDADAVSALIDELKDGLSDVIDGEASVNAIGKKWDAHDDLAGKTKTQILRILMSDLRSVVPDRAAQNKVWESWGGEEQTDKQPPVQAPKPVPSPSPTKPATPSTGQRQGGSGTVISFNADKGYGYIRPDSGGPDIFVHISALEQAGISTLNVNDRVTFEIEVDKRGKSAAVHIKMAVE